MCSLKKDDTCGSGLGKESLEVHFEKIKYWCFDQVLKGPSESRD